MGLDKTRRRRLEYVFWLGMACSFGGASSGCASKFGDTVHPRYSSFEVKRVGTIIWCAGYEPGEIRSASVPKLRLGTRMSLAGRWDEFLSPLMQPEFRATLEREGYDVVDLRDEAHFGDEARLESTLQTIALEHTDLNAVLVVTYCVSPFHVETTPRYRGSSGGTTLYRISVDEVNLKGRLKLFHLPTLTVLWELGDHSTYSHRSTVLRERDGMSKREVATAVCRMFGSAFGRPYGNVRGFPSR